MNRELKAANKKETLPVPSIPTLNVTTNQPTVMKHLKAVNQAKHKDSVHPLSKSKESSVDEGLSVEEENNSCSDAARSNKPEGPSTSYTSTVSEITAIHRATHALAAQNAVTNDQPQYTCLHKTCDSQPKHSRINKQKKRSAPKYESIPEDEPVQKRVHYSSELLTDGIGVLHNESATAPDSNIVNLLRYCIVALQLLPDYSMSSELVKTILFNQLYHYLDLLYC